AGMAAFIKRGNSNYDIDFTGGASVTMQFVEPQQAESVRSKLEESFQSKNITVEELVPFGAKVKGLNFRLRVATEGKTEISAKSVEAKVNDTFPGMLVKKSLSVGKIEPIEGKAGEGQFTGGHQVELKFTDPRGKESDIASATFGRYLEEQLMSLKNEKG